MVDTVKSLFQTTPDVDIRLQYEEPKVRIPEIHQFLELAWKFGNSKIRMVKI